MEIGLWIHPPSSVPLGTVMQKGLFKIQLSATFGYSVKWIPRLHSSWRAGWETGDWQSNWSNVPSAMKGSCSICIILKVSAIQSSHSCCLDTAFQHPNNPNMKTSEEQNPKASSHSRSASSSPSIADLRRAAAWYKRTYVLWISLRNSPLNIFIHLKR